jgi:gamma-glutamylcyclotransferase (GGCT)/AIG2-like uncharacterized protein YtfP
LAAEVENPDGTKVAARKGLPAAEKVEGCLKGRPMEADVNLFVYGSLLRAAAGGVHPLLSSGTRYAGRGLFQGRLFWTGDYPGAVRSAEPNDRVRGEVYRLLAPAAVLARLDAYEGCRPRDARPHAYRREKTAVHAGNRVIVSWVYLYNLSLVGLVHIASGDFAAWRLHAFPGTDPADR